jgi:hypothetical protein
MEKYLILFIIAIVAYTLLTCNKNRTVAISEEKITEGFSAQLSDLEAIRTLAMAARDLQAGGLNVKGNLNVSDRLRVNQGAIVKGNNPIGASDLGLYSQESGQWVRYVSNGGQHNWWSNYDKGSTAGDGEIMKLETNGNLTPAGTVSGHSFINRTGKHYSNTPAHEFYINNAPVVAFTSDGNLWAGAVQSQQNLTAHKDLTVKGKLRLKDGRWHENSNIVSVEEGIWGNWKGMKMCPAGKYVCGLEARFEPSQGDKDDTALNGIRMTCCDF